MRKIHFFLLCLIIFSFLHSCRESEGTKPFYSEIQDFKSEDKQHFPPKDAILFIGSSSIRMWDDMPSYFPGYTIIQRGFGGSGLNDAILYANDIIFPYHPKQIVIYSGENDIAMDASSTDVLQRFTGLFTMIREKLPDAGVIYISIKPSPSREKYMPAMEEANVMIRQFLSSYPKTVYVDIYHPMLDDHGKPRKELFIGDKLHMNKKGYAIWRDAITPYLVK
jgi:lysophospholipase L1-like esterase